MFPRLIPLLLVPVAFGAAAAEEPFHPYALEPMIPWLSDTRETVRVVRCAPEREFAEPVECRTCEEIPKIPFRHAYRSLEDDRRESLNYAVLHTGKSHSLLYVNDWGGGSGVFGSLMLVAPESHRLLMADLSRPAQPPATPTVTSVPAWRLVASLGTGDRTELKVLRADDTGYDLQIREIIGENPEVIPFGIRIEAKHTNP